MTRVAFSGALTNDAAHAVRSALAEAVRDHAEIAVDAAGVEYVGAAVMQVFAAAAYATTTAGGERVRLSFHGLPDDVAGLFRLMGLGDLVDRASATAEGARAHA